jgi:AcrR family transcriptional regulator
MISEDAAPAPVRPLRADARSNHERLLTVAAEAFAREGAGASLKAIAQDAGVGIGTLYRRFPTREALVEAVYRNEVVKLCTAASALLRKHATASKALRSWMERFVDFMATKHAMADALRSVLVSDDDRMQTREQLRSALATLLDAGVRDGVFRSPLDPNDVLLALGGVALIAGNVEQRAQARRLIELLMAGIENVQSGTPNRVETIRKS